MSEQAVATAFGGGLVAGFVLSFYVCWAHFKAEAEINRELNESAARYEKHWRAAARDLEHYVHRFRAHSEAFLESLEAVVQDAERSRRKDES